jgi:hypothetical protein
VSKTSRYAIHEEILVFLGEKRAMLGKEDDKPGDIQNVLPRIAETRRNDPCRPMN